MNWNDIEVGSLWMYDNSSAVFEVVALTDINSLIPGVVIRNTESKLYFYTLCKDFPEGRKQVQYGQALYRKMTAKPVEGIILKNEHREMCVDKNVKGDCPICKLIEED